VQSLARRDIRGVERRREEGTAKLLEKKTEEPDGRNQGLNHTQRKGGGGDAVVKLGYEKSLEKNKNEGREGKPNVKTKRFQTHKKWGVNRSGVGSQKGGGKSSPVSKGWKDRRVTL